MIAARDPLVVAEAGPSASLRSFAPFVPSVDASGRVAFQATLADGTTAVLVGDGEAPPTRLACDGPWRRHEVTSHPAIGPGGVAWYARQDEREALLLHDGETLRVLVGTGRDLTSIGPLGPVTDAHGAVAFRASRGDRTLAGVARENRLVLLDEPTLVRFAGLPVLGEASALMVRADDARGGSRIVRACAGGTEVLLATDHHLTSLGAFVCADGERIACSVLRADGSEALVERDRTGTRVIAETGARWQSLRGVLVAGAHTVFYATPVGGSLGVYVGRETPARIAALGDTLFGARITDLALNPVSIHRGGWLAMRLTFDDGTERIVRFDLRGHTAVGG